MIFKSEDFARKYAFIYTGILAILLIAPLIVYIQLLLQIDEAKVKLSLETQAKKVILTMQRYQNEDKIYHFPRYKEYKSALYDDKYQTIFSTLDFDPISFTEGFIKKEIATIMYIPCLHPIILAQIIYWYRHSTRHIKYTFLLHLL